MLLKDDYDLLNDLDCNVSILKDNKLEQILYYEKKYNKNSLSILYSDDFESEICKWRKLVQEFIRLNGDINQINQIVPVVYWGLTEQDKTKEYQICEQIIKYQQNSAVVISNKNSLYKKIISLMNKHGILVVLYTNNIEDFKLSQSNLIVIYNDKPNLMVANVCTNYVLSYNEIFYNDPRLNFIKSKIIYM